MWPWTWTPTSCCDGFSGGTSSGMSGVRPVARSGRSGIRCCTIAPLSDLTFMASLPPLQAQIQMHGNRLRETVAGMN